MEIQLSSKLDMDNVKSVTLKSGKKKTVTMKVKVK